VNEDKEKEGGGELTDHFGGAGGKQNGGQKSATAGNNDEIRRILIPKHRYSALRNNWNKIVSPIVKQLQLQIRFCFSRSFDISLAIKWEKHTKHIFN
jgi:hypothetical protein